MVKAKKQKDDGGPSSEEQISALESKRLQELALSRGLLSRSKANPTTPLLPTKTIRKCDGKDIVKKGHRKTKYLFAFPGLMAPVTGGKFGELTHLDSRNPTFYVDFPQGRLKLFGTIVYPKNKYLTMHFVPGRGDIVCEDCFESIVVFPEAWWIGTKEENPAELRLPMPPDLQQEKHENVDFTAGAGHSANFESAGRIPKAVSVMNGLESPPQQFPVERLQESASPMDVAVKDAPLRRSSRKSIETLNYTFSSSSEGTSDSASDSTDKRKGRHCRNADKDIVQSQSSVSLRDAAIVEKVQGSVPEQKSTVQTASKKEIGSSFTSTDVEHPELPGATALRGSLRQATLTSFLTKTDTFEASNVEVIEIEDLSQKAESGNGAISEHPRRTSTKGVIEESEDVQFSQVDGQSSSDSALKKNSGSRRGRGRGRGRGGRNAVTSGGRTGTKRRQSINEISSSTEDDSPNNDSTQSSDEDYGPKNDRQHR